jgi:ABC-type uncharacterized transport system substrate-binding protein
MSIPPISSVRPKSLQKRYRWESMDTNSKGRLTTSMPPFALASSVQMLLVQSSPLFAPHGKRIAEAAIEHRLPSMFIVRSYVDRGGLMSYGADCVAATRLAGTYVAKILKGAEPADLPVEQPTKYELIVNLKTAKAIGIEFRLRFCFAPTR